MPSRLAQVAAAQVPVVKVSNFLERLACRKHDGLQYLAGGSRSAVLRINCRGWRRWPVNLGAVLSSGCVSAASRQRELEQLQAGLSALERRGLFTFREDHLWPVIGRPVDQGRNLVGLHQVGRTGRQHDPQQPRILHIIVRSERPRIPESTAGIRSWMGRSKSLAWVVMMVPERAIPLRVPPRVPGAPEGEGFSRLHHGLHGDSGIPTRRHS